MCLGLSGVPTGDELSVDASSGGASPRAASRRVARVRVRVSAPGDSPADSASGGTPAGHVGVLEERARRPCAGGEPNPRSEPGSSGCSEDGRGAGAWQSGPCAAQASWPWKNVGVASTEACTRSKKMNHIALLLSTAFTI